MQHHQIHLAHLRADELPFDLVYADIMVVQRTNGATEWEVLATTRDTIDIGPGEFSLHMLAVPSGTLTGTAILVRNIDRCVVFRGTGPLHDDRNAAESLTVEN